MGSRMGQECRDIDSYGGEMFHEKEICKDIIKCCMRKIIAG